MYLITSQRSDFDIYTEIVVVLRVYFPLGAKKIFPMFITDITTCTFNKTVLLLLTFYSHWNVLVTYMGDLLFLRSFSVMGTKVFVCNLFS